MPQLGETVSEGKITTWFKNVGDPVAPGDNLFEIETDKTSMEVPAIAAGTLSEIRVAQGAVAPVGAVVAVIADAGAGAPWGPARTPAQPPAQPRQTEAAPAAAVYAQPAMASRPIALDPFREVRTPERNFGPAQIPGGAIVTPLARRLAGENRIELARIRGSGPRGRIVARDVEAAIGQGAPAGPREMAAALSAADVMALYRDTPFTEIPLDGMRKTIAARVTQAKQTIPHFYLTADIDVESLMKVRAETNAAAPKDKDGNPAFRLSVNDFLVKALALALQKVPAANAVWAEDRILRFRHSDIGVAVAIEGGLFTPVLRKVEMKSVGAISAEMTDLAGRARAKKLNPDEYRGGATAISNLGMYGVREFSAIINPPQATILAVGAAQRRPVAIESGGVGFANQMTVTLSCDHRVVDGATGAQLLAAFKALIEQPVTMLV